MVEGDEIHTRMGIWSSTTWWVAGIRKDVRDSGLGRRDGETLGGEKQEATGATILEEHQIPKCRSEPKAGRRTIPKESTVLGKVTCDVESTAGGDLAGDKGGSVDPKGCRTCNAILAMSRLEGVSENQRLRLNAALLCMVQGVADASSGEGVEDIGVLEAMETLSQVGLSQASTESYYAEEQENCHADPEPASKGVGAVGKVRVAPSLWQKWVPKGLCEKYKDWESEQPPKISKGKGCQKCWKPYDRRGGGAG